MRPYTKYKIQKRLKQIFRDIWRLLRQLCIIFTIYLVFRFADSHNKAWVLWLIPLVVLLETAVLFPRFFMPPYNIYYKGRFKVIFPRKIPEKTPEDINRDEDWQAASEAFQNRNYEKVIELLQPYQKKLSPLLREKLKYAQKKRKAGHDSRLNPFRQQIKNNN